MAKARVGLYSTKGDVLTRSHKFCPKCGPGTFLAEHPDRRSCGHCGYMESKPRDASVPVKAPVKAKPKPPKPAAAPAAATPAAPAAPAGKTPAAPAGKAPAPPTGKPAK